MEKKVDWQGFDDAALLESKLAKFDPDGSLIVDGAEIWSLLSAEREELSRAFWRGFASALAKGERGLPLRTLIADTAAQSEIRFGDLGNPEWVAKTRENYSRIEHEGVSLTPVHLGNGAFYASLQERLCTKLADDPARLCRLLGAAARLNSLHMDVIYTCHEVATSRALQQERDARSREFDDAVVSTLKSLSIDSRELRSLTSQASTAVRGTLSKTMEIETAAM